jgi:hypothetical protein
MRLSRPTPKERAMSRTTSTVRVAELAGIVEDPERGTISLVGDSGGLSKITGEVYASSLHLESICVETEHGSIYLGTELEVQISEHTPDRLAEEDVRDTDWLVEWNIDHSEGESSPRQAAEAVWRDIFGRTQAGTDDACVFFVTDPLTGERVEVDLSSAPLAGEDPHDDADN